MPLWALGRPRLADGPRSLVLRLVSRLLLRPFETQA